MPDNNKPTSIWNTAPVVDSSVFNVKSEFVGSEKNKSFGESKLDNTTPVSMVESGDYNYLRGERQSNLEKWSTGLGRAVTKLGVRTLNGIVSPIYGVASAIKNADWSKVWDNDVTNLTLEAEKKIDETLPMYSTRAAEDAKGLAKLAYVNTWAGSVLDGVSYSGAAILSGAAYTKALSAASKLASLDKLGATVAETMGMVTNIEDAADKTKFVIDLNSKAQKLKNGLNNGAIAAIGAGTEASANALNDANEFERQMIEQITGGQRDLTESEAEYLKMLKKSVGNSSYAMNLPVIMASNWLTFGRTMLGNSATEKLLTKSASRTEKDLVTGSYKASVINPVQKILDKTYGLRQVSGKALPEGLEEWEQLVVSKGVNDFYSKKYYNVEYNDFQSSFAKGLNEAMSSEGLENFLIGSISGGIFGNTTQIKTEGLKSYKNPQNEASLNQTLDYLNAIKGKDAFKNAVGMLNRHSNLTEEQDQAINKNDNFEINNNKSDMFINYVNHMVNSGKTEDLKSELESYKKLSTEEFEEVLGIKLGTDQLSNSKESVNQYISKRLDKINKIEQLSNSIDELHPNLSQNIKDRFMYTAWTLEDAQDRANILKQDVSFKLTKNNSSLDNIVALNVLNDLPNLSGEQRKAALDSIESNLKVSPLLKQEVLTKIKDLAKLIDRQNQFTSEFNTLANSKVQAILNDLDRKTEDEVSDALAKNDIKNQEQQEEDEIKAQINQQFENASKSTSSEVQPDLIEPLDELSQFVADKIINRKDASEQLTPEEQEIYDSNKEEIEAYIQSNVIREVEQQTVELIENVKPVIDIEINDQLSNGLTSSVDDKLDIDTSLAIGDKEFSSTRANALMMKFFHFTPNTKLWARDPNGDVLEESKPDVSTEVNNPLVALPGSKITYEHNGTDISLKDSDGRTVGFLALDHITTSQDPKVIAALELLKEIRKYILSKPTGSLSTIIVEKGHGKLLTKIKYNLPVLDQSVSSRPTDMIDGIPLFLTDNGVGLVGKNLTDNQDKVAQMFNSTTFSKNNVGVGRVYQAVKTANGSWYTIPVYTKLINELSNSQNIKANIISVLRDNITSATTINYSKVIQELNKYIFVTNSKNFPKNQQALRIKEDIDGVEGGKLSVGGVTVSFTDVKGGTNLLEFEQALGTVRHNLSLNDLNIPEYQQELSEVLVTNAYTSEGQYYVQPYIEVANPEGFEEIDNTEAKPSEDFKDEITNVDSKQPTSKPSFDVNSHTIEDEFGDAYSKTKLGGREITEKDISTLNKILPGLQLADAKLVQEVSENLKDTYGMFQGMLIYLFNGATNKTLYHEAFHGVFRNVLSNTERILLLQDARVKYSNPTKEDLNRLQNSQSNKLSFEILEQLYYEEKLADDFAEYADGVLNPSLGQKILNFFKKLFNLFRLFRNSNTTQIQNLFEAVTSGKLANRSLAARNTSIDISQFGEAYSRVFTDGKTPLSAELERTNAISNAILDGISRERSKGVPMSKVNIKKITDDIKASYDTFWKTEDAKPESEKNKNLISMAYRIVDRFPEIVENAKKQISMTRKITIKGNYLDINDIEGTVDVIKDQEDTTKMEGNTEKGFQEMTAISGIKSATHEIKLFLSNIPVVNKQGQIQKDAYGFMLFYPFEKLYYKLENSLIGTTTFKEQLNVLSELSKYSPEIKQVYNTLVNNADSNFKQQFAANFNKQMLNYKLITYSKRKDKFEFKIFDPNRAGVSLNLKNQWEINNIVDPTNRATDDIRTFNSELGVFQADPKKVEKLVDSYRSKGELNDKGKRLTTKLSVSEVFDLGQKLGIDLSYNTIELEASIIGDNNKPSLELLTDNLLTYAEVKWINPKATARQLLDRMIKLETSAQTELFTSSFNNVENSVVYAVQHQSFASKLVNKLTNPIQGSLLSQDLQRDPMNYKNSLLANRNMLSMFAVDGFKMAGDSVTGKKFNQIDSDDYLAMIINMYINSQADQNQTTKAPALYAPIIPAEKGLSFGFTGYKYAVGLLADDTIDPNTAIMKEFNQLFFNELARIRQTMIDLNTLPKEKLRDNYHTKKKLGLEFNLTNAIDNKLKAELDSFLETTINLNISGGTAPDGLKLVMDKNKELSSKVNSALLNNLNSIVKDSIDKLKSRDIIFEEDGKLSSNKITTKDKLENILTEWTLNSYLFNINSSLLINGDPAFYKGAEDNGKRFYQGYSMLKFADTSTIDNSYKLIKDGTMQINVVKDVIGSSRFGEDLNALADSTGNENIRKLGNDEYLKEDSVNSTDAQMFVSVAMYAELQKLFGVSSAELQEGFSNADIADAMNKNSIGILSVMKPFFYGVQWNNEYNRYEPIQVKCSIFPLTNKYVANNPLLRKHKELMDENTTYPQVLAFESTMKALSPFKSDIKDPSKPSIVTLDLNNFGEQVANPDHMLESDNSSLRQFKMLMYGMVEDDKTYGDKTGRQIKDEIAALDKANILESLKQVVDGFKGNKKELNEFIQKAITSRNSTSIIEKVFELKEDGTFQYPLDLINSKTTIQLISAIFSSEVIRQSFLGGSAVQATSVGLQVNGEKSKYKNPKEFQREVSESKELSELQTSLSWVRKDPSDPTSIDYMEVAVPYYLREFINSDGSIKDNIPEEMRKMIVYRIPTEGAHSMMPCKVVHFLPSEYKGVMLMPLEVTKQFGADFDFDKIFFMYKNYKSEKGAVEAYKFIDGDGENTTKLRYNELVKYTLKNNEDARKVIKTTNEELETFDYKLTKEDKLQLLIDENIIPTLDNFSNLSIIEQNIKPSRNNQLIDNYLQILRSVNMLESLITPSGPGAIAQVYDRVKKTIDNGNFFTPMYQLFNKDLFHKISMLKGVSALQVSGHAWSTEGKLKIKDKITPQGTFEQGVKIWNKEGKSITRNELSGIISDDGTKIVEELSAMMAVILDAVKTPDQLPSIGISMKTLPMWAYLVRLGLGSKVASQYTAQSAIKDLSLALESNDKQLKDKDFSKKDLKTVRAEYLKMYQESVVKTLAKVNQDLNNKDNFELKEFIEKNTLDKIKNYNRLSIEELDSFTGLSKEDLNNEKAFENIKLSSREFGFKAMPEYKKLKYLQMQVTLLNLFEENENVVKELGQLNTLFSINKETGPNFEDVNSKLEIYKSLSSSSTLIEGIEQLLNSDAISPYIQTVNAEYNVLAKHYNFASPFFNAVKDRLAKDIYGENVDFTRIPAEDRESINGFIQMFLDAENTFKKVYTDNNRISEADFVNDIKVLIASKIYPNYQYKVLGNNTISDKNLNILKNLTIFQSLEVRNIKNSNIATLALKGSRYELNQKESMINDIRVLYYSPLFRPLALRLIEHSFINTGMYTGSQSYFSLIDPSILQEMGLTNDRQSIRNDLNSSYFNPDRLEPIIDQLVRNNSKKFTKTYDNDNELFTILDDGKTLFLDNRSKDTRKQEIIHKDGSVTKYIRFKLNEDYTPIYKLDIIDKDEENTQAIYRQVNYLGQPGKRIEINPFGEVNTEFPNNRYEKFKPVVRGNIQASNTELDTFSEEDGSEDTTENLIQSETGQSEQTIDIEDLSMFSEEDNLDNSEGSTNLEDPNNLGLNTNFKQNDTKC